VRLSNQEGGKEEEEKLAGRAVMRLVKFTTLVFVKSPLKKGTIIVEFELETSFG
jgi:hypothetical protein